MAMWEYDGKEMLLEDELGGKNKMKIHAWICIGTISNIAQQILDRRD